ncbi:MAG TPA: stage VI sporulation protein F [Firmicutes bacterium]|nr:stage VI sporulation protein F [Bacillota bacterium]
MSDNIFDKVEKQTNVKKEDILKLAKRISGQDLSDDDNLRALIKDVAKLAGKEVSKEKEEKIISAVKKDKIPHNMSDLM